MTKRTITVCSCLLSLAQNDRAVLVADVVTFKELKPSHSVIALANTGTVDILTDLKDGDSYC